MFRWRLPGCMAPRLPLKDEGRLGVIDLEVQNTCLLLKMLDKLHQEHGS